MVSYVYNPNGTIARTVTASSWTEEDRALMLAWREYQDSLCKGCGHPKATAWHHTNDPDTDFAVDGEFVCAACTAAQKPNAEGKRERVTYPVVVDRRPVSQPRVGPPEPQLT